MLKNKKIAIATLQEHEIAKYSGIVIKIYVSYLN